MNPFLDTVVCHGPYEKPPGAGMSLRPEFYSGRGMGCLDVSHGQLVTICRGIQNGEAAGHFPVGAAEAFLQMVRALPLLTGTVFIRNLWRLDARDYTWGDDVAPSVSNFDVGPNDGPREAIALASILSMFVSPSDPASDKVQTICLRNRFFHSIDRRDLEEDVPTLFEDCNGQLTFRGPS